MPLNRIYLSLNWEHDDNSIHDNEISVSIWPDEYDKSCSVDISGELNGEAIEEEHEADSADACLQFISNEYGLAINIDDDIFNLDYSNDTKQRLKERDKTANELNQLYVKLASSERELEATQRKLEIAESDNQRYISSLAQADQLTLFAMINAAVSICLVPPLGIGWAILSFIWILSIKNKIS